MEVQKISAWIPVTTEQAADMEDMQRRIACSFFLMTFLPVPLTKEEQRTGWLIRQHDDHEHQIAVGWRREQENRDWQAKREAAMAACPYVECTCGYHDED